jgi:hypothetical protein
MKENTEEIMTNGQSRETGNIMYKRRGKTKTQHNMCWTSLHVSQHK